MRQLGDVDEPVGSRKHFHECAEIHDFPYGAEIGLADFDLFRQIRLIISFAFSSDAYPPPQW